MAFSAGENQYALAIQSANHSNLPFSVDEHHELILLDLKCEDVGDFLNMSQSKLSIHYTWLIVNTDSAKVSQITCLLFFIYVIII